MAPLCYFCFVMNCIFLSVFTICDPNPDPLSITNPFANLMDGPSDTPEVTSAPNPVPLSLDIDHDMILPTGQEDSGVLNSVIDSESNSSQLESVFGCVPLAPSVVPSSSSSPSMAVRSQARISSASSGTANLKHWRGWGEREMEGFRYTHTCSAQLYCMKYLKSLPSTKIDQFSSI